MSVAGPAHGIHRWDARRRVPRRRLLARRSPATAKPPSSNVQRPATMPVTLKWLVSHGFAEPIDNQRSAGSNERRCQEGKPSASATPALIPPRKPNMRMFECQWSGYGLAALVRAILAPGQQPLQSRHTLRDKHIC